VKIPDAQGASADLWNAFVTHHPQGNILQTSTWGDLKETFGWESETITLGDPSTPTAGALILYRPLPLHLGTLAYVPRGPLVDWANASETTALLAKIQQAAREHHAWAIWLEPELFDTQDAAHQLESQGLQRGHRSIQPQRTILVDISPDEDTILANMKQKTRYNIRLAGRKGVTIREGDAKEAETFHALMTETGTRDAFGIHSATYYQRVLENFQPKGQGTLLFAEVEGEPVAAIVVMALGEKAWYFYGASSNRHREKMPAYALQWEAIRWAKRQGCTVYDLWGIPDADEVTLEAEFKQRHDGLWGVYRFKRGFGGDVVRFTGLWEKSLHPLYPLAAKLQARTP